MLVMAAGSAIPEMTIALAEGARGQGASARLIEALASQAAEQFSVLALTGARAMRRSSVTGSASRSSASAT